MSYGANDPNGLPLGLPSILSLGLPPLVNPYPALNLDFINNQTLDPRITFTRASTATYFNSSGVLTTAASGAARFDYNPSTLQPRGLLIEEARTNLLLQSQFASGWSFSNASFTSTTIAPDGTNTGQVLNDSSAAAAGYTYQGVSVTSGTAYTFSVFAKSVGLTSITLRNFTQAGAVAFNLTGSGSADTPTGTFSSPAITAVGNGWYRCSVIFTATGTASNNIAFVANPTSFTGEAFAIWGAQLEAGAFATSYIPTTTTALTRNADVASMTGTNFSSWYNASEGTALTDFSFVGLRSVSGQRILTIDDGSSTNLIAQSASSTNALITSITDAGSSVMSTSSPATTFSANTQYKMLIAYKEDDSVAAVNGTVGTADTSNTIPTVTTLRLAASSTTSTSNCWFRRIAYYPTRLPDSTLQALTA